MPTIYDKHDIIKFSNELECKCGRLKNKIHCPNCGRARVRAYANRTSPVAMPNGDIMNKCQAYHCENCGIKFNDVDWWFNCHAPLRIDWQATKEAYKRRERERLRQEWNIRVEQGQRFTFNDHTQCRAQTGVELDEIISSVYMQKHAEERQAPPIIDGTQDLVDLTWRVEQTKKQIANNEEHLKTDPEDKDVVLAINYLKNKLRLLEFQILLKERQKNKGA